MLFGGAEEAPVPEKAASKPAPAAAGEAGQSLTLALGRLTGCAPEHDNPPAAAPHAPVVVTSVAESAAPATAAAARGSGHLWPRTAVSARAT